MKVNPRDPIVKFAILVEHKFTCFYSGNRLNLLNCTIDHIIAKSFDSKPDILIKYIDNYNGVFDYDNIDNLVPASFDANVAKGDKEYDINTILHYLEQAKSKSANILKRIDQLRKNKNTEKMLAIISSHIFSSEDPKDEVSKVIEFISNERSTFKEQRRITEKHFFRSLPSISIQAHLPTSFNEQGSCLLLFHSLFVSDCMITLNHSQIVNQLFTGLYSKQSYEKRGFVLFNDNYSPNIYYVQLGNNRFTLLKKEVEELCIIVDDLATVYIDRFKLLEIKYGTRRFSEIDPINFSVNLMRISRSLWKKLLQFTWEFDYSNGSSEWHIFNATQGTIIVYPFNDIAAQFTPGSIPHQSYESYTRNEDTLNVFWKPSTTIYNQKIVPWDCMKAYTWFTKEFIPYVIYYYDVQKNKRKWFQKKPKCDHFLTQFNIESYIYSSNLLPEQIEIQSITQFTQLYEMVSILQTFFTTYRNIYIDIDEAINLLKVVEILCLHTTELPTHVYDYIGYKLSCEDKTHSGIYNFIKQKIKNCDFVVEPEASTIDVYCRCIKEILDYTEHSSQVCFNTVILNEKILLLQPIWDKYILEISIRRMQQLIQ